MFLSNLAKSTFSITSNTTIWYVTHILFVTKQEIVEKNPNLGEKQDIDKADTHINLSWVADASALQIVPFIAYYLGKKFGDTQG